jgi:hypothetical protein
VYYALHPVPGEAPSRHPAACAPWTRPSGAHSRSHAGTDLQELALQCAQHLAPHLNGYLWQRDCFRLNCSDQEPPPWLYKQGAGS